MSNGEKVPPGDMENAILRDHLFEHVLLYGDGHSYLVALAVINPEQCQLLSQQDAGPVNLPELLKDSRVEEQVLHRIAEQIKEFPGYAKVRRATLMLEPWSIENGLQTPTLKIKRACVFERYANEIARLYEGH
jgi:long-chain acyl-CoA synthetase